MGKENYTDRRILHTRKFLRDALIELLKEKPIGKITPTELCKRADINRNTFYSHYSSPEELLERLEEELFSEIEKGVSDLSDALEATTMACRAMRKHKDITMVLLTNNADPSFSARVFEISYQRSMDLLVRQDNDISDNYRQMIAAFSIHGGAAIMQVWVQNGMVEEPEDIALLIQKACMYGNQAIAPRT